MPAKSKKTQQLARQLFKVSMVDGALSSERVLGVLEWIEKHAPAQSLAVLKAYHRLVSIEVARNEALVEHAGSVDTAILDGISAHMSRRYGRPILWRAKAKPSLLAGLRVRVGDDIYESSAAARIEALRAAT